MEYLVRGRDRRTDPRLVFPGAKSILCVAIPYTRKPAGAADLGEGPRYARYLQDGDYHQSVADRLERAMTKLLIQFPELKWKVCVDTSAILERSWAVLAGLGWVGKNTMLIHPKYGSYLFIAEVLINLETHHGPAPLPDFCGNCRRCLDGCPTKAFSAPRTMNATRCISYWTLEKRGELLLEEKDRLAVGPWIAGCDICQEVCPFNIKPTRELQATPLGQNATLVQTWRELLQESEESYKARVKFSALKRVKPAQFRRNLALTLANAVAQAKSEGDSSFSLLQQNLLELVRTQSEIETDSAAKIEWARCMEFLNRPDESHKYPRAPDRHEENES